MSSSLSRPVLINKVRAWHLFDANKQVVGRMAQRIALMLQGKHKPTYWPHIYDGDTVVVVNAERVVFTGRKWTNKFYKSHTGYPGGLKEVRADMMLAHHPTQVLRKAVWGMLPRNKTRNKMLNRLKIYSGPLHPHAAQFAKQNDHIAVTPPDSMIVGDPRFTAPEYKFPQMVDIELFDKPREVDDEAAWPDDWWKIDESLLEVKK